MKAAELAKRENDNHIPVCCGGLLMKYHFTPIFGDAGLGVEDEWYECDLCHERVELT